MPPISVDHLNPAGPGPPGNVYQRDLATGHVVGSPGLAAFVGAAHDSAGWFARIHPEDLPRLSAARDAALAGRASEYRLEYRIRHGDGRWIEVLDHALVIRDGGGRAVREIGVLTDRSPIARDASPAAPAEADRQAVALHASAERLRLATRAARLCLWDYDVLDDALDWAEECRALFGLAPGVRVTHAAFLAAVHPADRGRIARAIELAFDEYAEYDVEFRIVRPDGEERWVAAVGDCLHDPLGRAERFLGVMIDITDRKRAEAALRESEERFRQLAESIDDAFWIYDARAGRQTYVSPGYAPLFGQDAQELYRDPDAWLRSVHPEDRAQMARAYAPDPPLRDFIYEYRIALPAGVRWARERGVVLRDASGWPVRIVGITEDITERRRAEEVVRDTERRRFDFLALLAEALRGPLVPLAEATEQLRVAAAARADLRPIHGVFARQLNRLSRLVGDLFDLTRIAHGALDVRVEPLDVATVVERAVELLRPTIEARALALAVDVAAARMPVHGDPARLTQALANVLQNAAMYTPHGGRVSVAAAPRDGMALITVSDTGVGIAPAKLEQIFEPFVRAEAVLSDTARGGLGIGLTLVRRLVQLHGGTVRAASAGPGRGSRFVIALPLAA